MPCVFRSLRLDQPRPDVAVFHALSSQRPWQCVLPVPASPPRIDHNYPLVLGRERSGASAPSIPFLVLLTASPRSGWGGGKTGGPLPSADADLGRSGSSPLASPVLMAKPVASTVAADCRRRRAFRPNEQPGHWLQFWDRASAWTGLSSWPGRVRPGQFYHWDRAGHPAKEVTRPVISAGRGIQPVQVSQPGQGSQSPPGRINGLGRYNTFPQPPRPRVPDLHATTTRHAATAMLQHSRHSPPSVCGPRRINAPPQACSPLRVCEPPPLSAPPSGHAALRRLTRGRVWSLRPSPFSRPAGGDRILIAVPPSNCLGAGASGCADTGAGTTCCATIGTRRPTDRRRLNLKPGPSPETIRICMFILGPPSGGLASSDHGPNNILSSASNPYDREPSAR